MSENNPVRADKRQLAEAFTADDSPSTDAMQAEIQTLESILQKPRPETSCSNDEECRRIVRLVEQIGATPQATKEDTPPVDETPYERLGHYELLEKLGEGGMGAVYKARHTKLNKLVALKVLPADRLKDEQAIARFEREMLAVGQLSHSNIVAAHDAGEVEGNHYLVMELVDGVDLSTLVRRCGPLPLAEACEVICHAAEGLQYAHISGMVHRDIKPGNLMLTNTGQVKILDMGLALLDELKGPSTAELTTTGQMMGTLDYMAPEQGTDSHHVDIRADVYSLGATLFKLITGEAPFHGPKYETPVSKMMALAVETPRTLSDVRDDVPPELSDIVARMLAKKADERPATPQEVIDLLAPFAADAQLREVARLTSEEVEGEAEAPSADTFAHLRSSYTETLPTIEKAPLEEPQVAVTPVVPPRNSRRWWIAAAALVPIVIAAVVISLRTPQGTIIVEVPEGEEDNVEISVRQGGEEIEVLDAAKGWTVEIKEGKYQLDVKKGGGRFAIENNELTVTRDGKARVKVEFKPTRIASPDRTPIPDKQRSYGLRLNGYRDHAVTPLSLSKAPITIEATVFVERYQGPRMTIVGNQVQKGADRGVGLWLDSGGRPAFGVGLKDHKTLVTSTAKQRIPLGKKIHLAGVWDGKRLRIFVDGIMQDSMPKADVAMVPSEVPIRVGMGQDSSTDGRGENFFAGVIDDIRISSAARYANHFRVPERIDADKQTLALYTFKDADGEIIWDVSKKEQHARIVSAQRVPETAVGYELSPREGERTPYAVLTPSSLTPVQALAFSPDDTSIATASDDNQVRVWEWKNGKQATSFDLRGDIWGIAFHPDGQRVAARGHGARLLDIKKKKQIWDHNFGVKRRSIAVSPNGKIIATAAGDKKHVVLLDADSGKPLGSLAVNTDANGVSFSPDGTLLAVACRDRSVQLWNTETQALAHKLNHTAGVNDVVFSPSGDRLASCDEKGNLVVWDLSNRKPVWTTSGGGGAVAFSSDGSLLATVGGRTAKVWTTATGNDVATFSEHGGALYDVAFSPDGKYLATACRDGLVRIWDVAPRDASSSADQPPQGTIVKLTELKPLTARAGFRGYHATTNGKGPMIRPDVKVAQEYLFAHAPSRISYAVPKGMKSFTAVAYAPSYWTVKFKVMAGDKMLHESAGPWGTIRVDLPPDTDVIDLILAWNHPKDRGSAFWIAPRLHPVPADEVKDQFSIDGDYVRLTKAKRLLAFEKDGELLVNRPPKNMAPPVVRNNVEQCKEYIYANPESRAEYEIPVGATAFSAVGYAKNGGVQFKVYADKALIYSSPKAGIVPVKVEIPKGTSVLALEITGWNFRSESHWCYPRFHVGGSKAAAGVAHALEFDESKGTCVEIPSLRFDGTKPITVEAWVKAPAGAKGAIVGSSQRAGCALYANGHFDVRQGKGGKTFSFAATDWMPTNRWYHLAATFNGESVQVFADGKPVKGTVSSRGGYSAAPFSFKIGARPSGRGGTPEAFFTGMVDEVRISTIARYQKEFSPARVFRPDEHTLALYHFDAGNGNIVKDSSGNKHHGKIAGAKWAASKDVDRIQSTVSTTVAAKTHRVKQLAVFGHNHQLRYAWISPDGKAIVSSDQTNAVNLYDVAIRKLRKQLKVPSGVAYGAQFSPDGKTLAILAPDGNVELWFVETAKQRCNLSTETTGHAKVLFTPDSKSIVTTAKNGGVSFWNVADGKQLKSIGENWGAVGPMSFSKDGQLLAVACRDKTILAWDCTNSRHRATLSGPGTYGSLILSDDGSQLWATSNGQTYRWNLQKESEPQKFAGDVLSPQKTWTAAVGGNDPIANVMRVATGQKIQFKPSHVKIHQLAFSPDDRILVTGDHRGNIAFWDPATGREIANRVNHGGWINTLSFSADSRLLVSSSWDKRVGLWKIEPTQLAPDTKPTPALKSFPAGGTVEEKKAWVVVELKRLNSGFEFEGKSGVEVREGKIVGLGLIHSPGGLPNIAPLAELRHLERLDLHGSTVTDLSPLREMRLKHVTFTDCKKLSDLSPLAGMPIDFLYINSTAVTDLSPLRNMPLKTLACFYTKVADLSPLAAAPLQMLHIKSTRVSDLTPLKNTPLENLHCNFEADRDAPILRQIKTLKTINGNAVAQVLGTPTEKKPKPKEKSTSLREWTDKSGKHKVRAELVGVEGDTARLRKADGKIVELPLSRLSEEDQAVVKEWIARKQPPR